MYLHVVLPVWWCVRFQWCYESCAGYMSMNRPSMVVTDHGQTHNMYVLRVSTYVDMLKISTSPSCPLEQAVISLHIEASPFCWCGGEIQRIHLSTPAHSEAFCERSQSSTNPLLTRGDVVTSSIYLLIERLCCIHAVATWIAALFH